MRGLRKLLFPFSAVYYLITLTRNWLYDQGFLSSTSYLIPVICIGNLSTGGTGKTPMTEYILQLLSTRRTAVLSRGYGRKTSGYIEVSKMHKAVEVGDEPLQYASKFPSASVAVCEDRRAGIEMLIKRSQPEVILLDDAFQHRRVKPGFSILLTKYEELFLDDFLLPAGNLREPRHGARRAQAVVITKCPDKLPIEKQKQLLARVGNYTALPVFLSKISYPNYVTNHSEKLALSNLPQDFVLVTGIADASPLVKELREKGLKFQHWEFPDHHRFRESELKKIKKASFVLTTEKDFMRFQETEAAGSQLYYMPMKTVFLGDGDRFDELVQEYLNSTRI